MNLLQRVENWGDHHHPKWLDIIRIALGVFLLIKGIEFLNNMSTVMDLMTSQVPFNSFILILLGHYIVFAHIVGGFLLILGILTRFACLIQIPILLGAIIFINSGNIMQPYSELIISILVLILLIYFLIVGNGPWSLANTFYGNEKQA